MAPHRENAGPFKGFAFTRTSFCCSYQRSTEFITASSNAPPNPLYARGRNSPVNQGIRQSRFAFMASP